jgi:hypothetical protein
VNVPVVINNPSMHSQAGAWERDMNKK